MASARQVANAPRAGRRGWRLRLSTVPIEQSPFTELVERVGEEGVRADVLRGGYRLREPGEGDDAVAIATCGTLVPQALEAARMLEEHEGVAASVVVLSSPDRLYRGCRLGGCAR